MKIGLVCSHGGHLTEITEFSEIYRYHDFFFITYKSERTLKLQKAYLIENFAEKPFTLFLNILKILRVLMLERPRILISTGAEIAIPTFFIAKLLGIKTVYIESCARVRSPSITGLLVYRISDYFFVQWKDLLPSYGKKAKFAGGLL